MEEYNTDTTAVESTTDLDEIVQEFNKWQKSSIELYQENKSLGTQVKALEKKCELYSRSEKQLMDDNMRLNEIVKDLHSVLNRRCDYEDEACQLKHQVQELHRQIISIEDSHKHQLEESMDTLTTLRQAHREDIAKAQDLVTIQMKKDIDCLNETIASKEGDIKQLQKSLAELEREKHTELVKLRLEYDAKLLKLQKQNMKSQTVQQSSVHSNIYRQKLQAIQSEHEKETSTLKKKVNELEKQIDAYHHSGSSGSKRRRF